MKKDKQAKRKTGAAAVKKTTTRGKNNATKKAITKKSTATNKGKTTATDSLNTANMIEKQKLIARVSKAAGISISKATTAYETILKETPSFRKQSAKTVKLKHEVAIKAKSKPTVKTVKVAKEKIVKTKDVVEKIKKVEVIKEVIVEVVKKVEVVKEVEVIKEVPVVVVNEVIVEVEVFREVPVEVIKEITMIREVKVPVEIIKEVPVEIIREVEVVKSIDFDSLKKMMAKMGTVEVSKKVVGETRTAQKATIVDRREIGSTSTRGEATITRGKTTLLTGEAAEQSKKNASKSSSRSTARVNTSSKSKGKSTKTDKHTSSSSKASKKDDLKKVEGIGPKIEQLLNNDGIHTWKQLAEAKVSRIQKILDAAGPRYKMHNPGSWPKQSSLAAKGKWDQLKKLQDELNGGR